MDKSLYDYWVNFISLIVGENAPSIIYAFSFILFILLFFATFFGVIKFILGGFKK